MTPEQAPIYTAAFDLCAWLCARMSSPPGRAADPVPHLAATTAVHLLRTLGLALTGRRPDEHLEAADEYLVHRPGDFDRMTLPIHPRWLRCSSVIWPTKLRSSRLAIGAPRHSQPAETTRSMDWSNCAS